MFPLEYTDDEVNRFHPEFLSAANVALENLLLDNTHEWIHHDTTANGAFQISC